MISADQLGGISAKVRGQEYLSDDTVTQLRQDFPDIHFTYCMDDDVAGSAKPVYEHPRFNLYLVDSRQECLCLTNDLDIASGVVVAEVEEE
jgi:hypothetical protein